MNIDDIQGEYVRFYATDDKTLPERMEGTGSLTVYHQAKDNNQLYIEDDFIASGYGFPITYHLNNACYISYTYVSAYSSLYSYIQSLGHTQDGMTNDNDSRYVKIDGGDATYTYVTLSSNARINTYQLFDAYPAKYDNMRVESLQYKLTYIDPVESVQDGDWLDDTVKDTDYIDILHGQHKPVYWPVNARLYSVTVNAGLYLGGTDGLSGAYITGQNTQIYNLDVNTYTVQDMVRKSEGSRYVNISMTYIFEYFDSSLSSPESSILPYLEESINSLTLSCAGTVSYIEYPGISNIGYSTEYAVVPYDLNYNIIPDTKLYYNIYTNYSDKNLTAHELIGYVDNNKYNGPDDSTLIIRHVISNPDIAHDIITYSFTLSADTAPQPASKYNVSSNSYTAYSGTKYYIALPDYINIDKVEVAVKEIPDQITEITGTAVRHYDRLSQFDVYNMLTGEVLLPEGIYLMDLDTITPQTGTEESEYNMCIVKDGGYTLTTANFNDVYQTEDGHNWVCTRERKWQDNDALSEMPRTDITGNVYKCDRNNDQHGAVSFNFNGYNIYIIDTANFLLNKYLNGKELWFFQYVTLYFTVSLRRVMTDMTKAPANIDDFNILSNDNADISEYLTPVVGRQWQAENWQTVEMLKYIN